MHRVGKWAHSSHCALQQLHGRHPTDDLWKSAHSFTSRYTWQTSYDPTSHVILSKGVIISAHNTHIKTWDVIGSRPCLSMVWQSHYKDNHPDPSTSKSGGHSQWSNYNCKWSIPGLDSSFSIYPCEPTSYQWFTTNMAGRCSNKILGVLAGLEVWAFIPPYWGLPSFKHLVI